MSAKHDGGAAFPHVYSGTRGGMTLRDWFAGQALAGLCVHTSCDAPIANHAGTATQAYRLADAMLAERAQ